MKTIGIEIKWAIYFIVMMLSWMLIEKLSGLHDVHLEQHAIYTNFVMIPAILVYFFALKDKRENFFGGKITYGQAFKSGAIITAIITIATPLTQYITSTIITPDYFENIIAYSVENNMVSLEEAQAYFNLKNYIIQSTIFTPFMGVLTTAVVSIFIKRK